MFDQKTFFIFFNFFLFFSFFNLHPFLRLFIIFLFYHLLSFDNKRLLCDDANVLSRGTLMQVYKSTMSRAKIPNNVRAVVRNMDFLHALLVHKAGGATNMLHMGSSFCVIVRPLY